MLKIFFSIFLSKFGPLPWSNHSTLEPQILYFNVFCMLFQNLKSNFKNFDITFNFGELHLAY